MKKFVFKNLFNSIQIEIEARNYAEASELLLSEVRIFDNYRLEEEPKCYINIRTKGGNLTNIPMCVPFENITFSDVWEVVKNRTNCNHPIIYGWVENKFKINKTE